jgi:hypothetical protein
MPFSKGFTIGEIVIGIALLSFGVVLTYGSFTAISTSTYNLSPKITATYLAQEGMEIIRNLRDNNFLNGVTWNTGLLNSPCNTGCQLDYKTSATAQLAAYNDTFLGLNSDGFYSYDIGATQTIFKRKITITQVQSGANTIDVQSQVTWTYKGQVLSYTTEEHLYNWH